MKSFLTGSRRYGVPRDDSDTDVVIFADAKDHALFDALIAIGTAGDMCSARVSNFSIRIGKLNLIVLTDEREFQVWRDVADTLSTVKGTDKQSAIAAHEKAKKFLVIEKNALEMVRYYTERARLAAAGIETEIPF